MRLSYDLSAEFGRVVACVLLVVMVALELHEAWVNHRLEPSITAEECLAFCDVQGRDATAWSTTECVCDGLDEPEPE